MKMTMQIRYMQRGALEMSHMWLKLIPECAECGKKSDDMFLGDYIGERLCPKCFCRRIVEGPVFIADWRCNACHAEPNCLFGHKVKGKEMSFCLDCIKRIREFGHYVDVNLKVIYVD